MLSHVPHALVLHEETMLEFHNQPLRVVNTENSGVLTYYLLLITVSLNIH